MSTQQPNSFPRRMEQASSLPAHDAVRVDVEQAVMRDGSADSERWNALLHEAQQIREALADVPVPPDLNQRLLTIPETVPTGAVRQSVTWLPWTVAAVVFLIAGFVVAQYLVKQSHLQTVAVLAINNHANHVDDENNFHSGTAVDVERRLSTQLNFDVHIPSLGDSIELVGGRPCKLGRRPVAYTLWRRRAGKVSLFQFQPDEFGLPREMQPKRVHVRGSAVIDGPDEVLIWINRGRGYALVAARPSDLKHFSF